MTKEEFAALITGREYPLRLTKEENANAKAAGLVVIYGASDDLMEFSGAADEELGAYDGTTARLCANGQVFKDWESVDHDDEDEAEAYFKAKFSGFHEVEALWCKEEGYSWTYRTAVPHATFEVIEDGGPYCRGIVIDIADLKAVQHEQRPNKSRARADRRNPGAPRQ